MAEDEAEVEAEVADVAEVLAEEKSSQMAVGEIPTRIPPPEIFRILRKLALRVLFATHAARKATNRQIAPT